jgi:hypothetical protein
MCVFELMASTLYPQIINKYVLSQRAIVFIVKYIYENNKFFSWISLNLLNCFNIFVSIDGCSLQINWLGVKNVFRRKEALYET